MKAKSIQTELILLGLLATIMATVGAYIYSYHAKESSIEVLSQKTAERLNQTVSQMIESKQSIGVNSVAVLASSPTVVQGFIDRNPTLLDQAYRSMNGYLKQHTELKNVQVRFIAADGVLVHSSTPQNIGKSVKHIAMYDKPLSDKSASVVLDVNSLGIGINAISPVFSPSGEFLGIINFIQGLRSVSSALEKEGLHWVQLIKKSAYEQSNEPKIQEIANNTEIANGYVLPNDKFYKPESVSELQVRLSEIGHIATEELFIKGWRYGHGAKYMFASQPILNAKSELLGYSIVFEDAADMEAYLAQQFKPIDMIFYAVAGTA